MAKKKDLSDSIRKVMFVYLLLLVGLISYIAYFQLIKAPKIAQMDSNTAVMAAQNEVIRGDIKDKDGNVLAKSTKSGDLTQKREYPYGEIYSHPIGYASGIYGNSGLEGAYSKELTTYENISLKAFLKSFNLKKDFKERNEKDSKVGNSIVTTLDTDLQKAAYAALGANRGAVVAMNPKTGEVLASVSKPGFNPNDMKATYEIANNPNGNPKDAILVDRAINGQYPPGSTFKVVTLTSALENIPGVTQRTFSDNGTINVGTKDLPNENGTAYGDISLRKALSVSSNVVFGGILGEELGNKKLRETAEKYGFNQDLSLGNLKAFSGKFPDRKTVDKGLIAYDAIGQGDVLASPLEMAMVASAVANNGVLMQPYMVSKIVDKDGDTVKEFKSEKKSTVMSKNDAQIINEYMQGVTNDRINDNWGYFRGMNVAAKTGTAQVPDGNSHAWLIAFAPANDPQIAVATIVENGGSGSRVAAPVTAKVMQAYFNK
ncbi:penicillin-binding protein [Clostridium perfringens]|nr:penicillin-binding protein [Clostridium perfringens]